MHFKNGLVFIILAVFNGPVVANEWSHRGEIALESRYFKNDQNSATRDEAYSVFSRVDTQFENENVIAQMRGYARVDEKNSSRNLIVPEDLSLGVKLGQENQVQIMAGYRLFNWSTMEAFHPADVINSRNYDSEIENLEKMGELTLGSEIRLAGGELGLYYFPYYQAPNYPGRENRLGIGSDLGEAKWIDHESSWGAQLALSWAQTLGPVDFHLFSLRHRDRTNPLIGTTRYTSIMGLGVIPLETQFSPHFFEVDVHGLTSQFSFDEFLFKFEAVHKEFKKKREIYTLDGLKSPKDHTIVAVGSEWGHSFENGTELSLFLEFQNYNGVSKNERALLSVFQRDLMLGGRYSFNDVMGTEVVASLLADLERSHEYLLNMSFARRLSDQWKFKIAARCYDAPQKGAIPKGLEYLHQDHYMTLTLQRFF